MTDKINKKKQFPKEVPNLTSEQKIIKDDFMKFWLKVSREKYRIYEGFNHTVVVNNRPKNFLKTLEIGPGLGEHINYENLNDDQKKRKIYPNYQKKIFYDFRAISLIDFHHS